MASDWEEGFANTLDDGHFVKIKIIHNLIRTLINYFGFDVRRIFQPFIAEIDIVDRKFDFWIVNLDAKSWYLDFVRKNDGEIRALRSLCAPGGLVLDVGAHHGFFTTALAHCVGLEGHVFAFEANAENAIILNANVALNHLRNCTCVYAAVGE